MATDSAEIRLTDTNRDTPMSARSDLMPSKCSVFVAASLDGFIARPDGELDWLDEANAMVPPDEDCGFAAFLSTVDTIVMGRSTFEKVLTFGHWPYGERPVFVLTRNPFVTSEELPKSVQFADLPPEELLQRIAVSGYRHVYVDGGRTIGSFLATGAIDRLTVTLIPILLGSGLPLFGPLPADVRLSLETSRVFEFGFVQLTYRVDKIGAA